MFSCQSAKNYSFFRGAILNGFHVAGAARTGVLMSSILSAFVHFELINMPVLILSGVILAVLYLKTGRLLPCVVAQVSTTSSHSPTSDFGPSLFSQAW